MTAYVSNGPGSWQTTTIWTPNGLPGAGDTVQVNHAVTIDADTIIGLNLGQWLAGTGTMTNAVSGTSITTSADLTAQLRIGDQFTANGGTHTVLAITATTITIGANVNFASVNYSFTYCNRAIYILGAAGTLTVSAGKKLTVRGDVVVKTSSLTLAAGATLAFDSSTATGTPVYRVVLGAGEQNTFIGSLIANGTNGSHCTINIVAGSGACQVVNAATGANGVGTSIASTINLAYTDITGLGSASTPALDTGTVVANYSLYCVGQATLQGLYLDHVTFSQCGPVTTGSGSINSDVSIKNVNWKDSLVTNAAAFIIINLNSAPGTVTGTRLLQDSVLHVPMGNTLVAWIGNPSNYTVQRNIFNQTNSLNYVTNVGNFALIDSNFWYVRYMNGTTNGWSFLGVGGDTITNGYFLNDEGPAQTNEHQLMSVDGLQGPVSTTWRLTNYVFERVGPTPTSSWDISHAAQSGTTHVAQTFLYDHILAIPMSDGTSPGHIRARGDQNTATYSIHHCTLINNAYAPSITSDGSIVFGSQYVGFAGMINTMQDNLAWSKTINSQAGNGGLFATYARSNANGLADLVNATNATNNFVYNGKIGTTYNATGGAAVTTYALDYFWQTTAIPTPNTLGNDPNFVDPSRNVATFSSAYLGNGGAVWVDAHAYNVNDLVSVNISTFYNNATVLFRCTKAHTSAIANQINGQPGSVVSQGTTFNGTYTAGTTPTSMSSYRQNWEFDSVYQIRQAKINATTITDASLGLVAADYIKTLWTWVRAGFAPQNAELKNADHTGTAAPGAIDYVPANRLRRNRQRPSGPVRARLGDGGH